MPALRICYLGLPLGALVLARHGVRPVALCVGHPDAAGMRRLRRTLAPGAMLLGRPELEDPSVARALLSTGYDVLLSWFWPRRIPLHLLKAAGRGAFGCHPSLLPRHRGPDPYFHVLASGETRTGVTLHRLDAEYDTGRVVTSIALDVCPDDDAWRLARRLDRPSLALLVGAAHALESGMQLEGRAQDPRLATQAPAPDEDMLCLRVAEPASSLERLVRASAPLGAVIDIGEFVVHVLRARTAPMTPLLSSLAPGEAAVIDARVVVRCADGGLILERIRVEPEETQLCGLEIASLLPK